TPRTDCPGRNSERDPGRRDRTWRRSNRWSCGGRRGRRYRWSRGGRRSWRNCRYRSRRRGWSWRRRTTAGSYPNEINVFLLIKGGGVGDISAGVIGYHCNIIAHLVLVRVPEVWVKRLTDCNVT